MVSSEYFSSFRVSQYTAIISRTRYPIRKAEMMEAMKMPVPVADNQFSLKMASSIFGAGATGGIF